MKTKMPSPQKSKPSIPHCPYEIPISTIYNPNCKDSVPVVAIYNPNLNQNTRPPERKTNSAEVKPSFKKIFLEKLKAQFHKDRRQKLEFYAALCFLLTLVVTGAAIVILHKSTTKDLLLVHGEFTILNVEYSSAFSHRNSSHFKHISKEICHAVDNTFLVPATSDFYRHCKVTAISSNMNCHVMLKFANDPRVTIGQIGLTFIRGLRILHGITWLGTHSVDVQSIGFMISGQEGKWGEWTAWSPCNATLHVSTRTRPCLGKNGERLTSVDRCLLIPGVKSDLDIRKCSPDSAVERAGNRSPWEDKVADERASSEGHEDRAVPKKNDDEGDVSSGKVANQFNENVESKEIDSKVTVDFKEDKSKEKVKSKEDFVSKEIDSKVTVDFKEDKSKEKVNSKENDQSKEEIVAKEMNSRVTVDFKEDESKEEVISKEKGKSKEEIVSKEMNSRVTVDFKEDKSKEEFNSKEKGKSKEDFVSKEIDNSKANVEEKAKNFVHTPEAEVARVKEVDDKKIQPEELGYPMEVKVRKERTD